MFSAENEIRRMYHCRVLRLAESVLRHIRGEELVKPGDRVGVAVSGGADSVALLRLMTELRQELGIVLSTVHFNHQLRGAAADADEQFVAELARQHHLAFHCDRGDVAAYAAVNRLSLEAAARALRYEYFTRLLQAGRFNRIATAHTLDDQAETLLLRLARGAGTRGLAGIYPRLPVPSCQFSDGSQLSALSSRQAAWIVRPLLRSRRKDLESYLAELGQEWREDATNRDLRHARNRVRHGVLPRMERHLNPAVREALAETAEIARAEEEYWEREVAQLLPQVYRSPALKICALVALPLALQRRVVRAAAEELGLRLEFRQVNEILLLAADKAAKSATLPDGWVLSRTREELRFEPHSGKEPSDYEYILPVPGRIAVPEAHARIEAEIVATAVQPVGDLLDRALIARQLLVRNWRAGDRFWPAHSKGPKKIKELLQERNVTGGERKSWPVIVSGTEIVWVRGFAAAAGFVAGDGTQQKVRISDERGFEGAMGKTDTSSLRTSE